MGDSPKANSATAARTETIVEMVSRIAQTVPEESWATVPTDLSKNLDSYLYGKKHSSLNTRRKNRKKSS